MANTKPRCRCQASLTADGRCPFGCPAKRPIKSVRRFTPEPERLPGDTVKMFRAGAKRVGVPSQAWGSVSAKGAADSKARRRS